MLQLYDLNKVKISNLTLYKDLKIQSVLNNGDKTLSFSYPSRSSDEIKEEGYIRTKTHEFVIKEISTNGDWKSIKAVLNVEDLEGKTWEHFDTPNQTITECLTLALAGTGWMIEYCNETKKRTIRKTNCSTWDIIQEIKKTYFVEMEFDTLNKRINIAKKLGNDKGVYFIDSLNLKDLDVKSNSYDFCTRLIAIGEDDLKVTVENYQYSSKKKTIIWKAEKYTDENSLREDAIVKLEELSKPYRSYGADIVDLASINEKYSILSYGLGDIITLISKEEGIKEKQRIVKMVEYPDEPDKNTCEIANTVLTFEDMQKEYEDTSKTVNNITSSNGTISEGAIKGTVEKITIKKADIESLNAVEIRVGDLEATSATITQLDVANANIANLQANKADIGELNAGVGRINILESSVGDIKTLVNGNLTSNNIQSLILSSDKVTVANGFIKNAMIENVDVGKILAGDISTNKFRIKSDNGGIEIVGATQQFKDKNNRVRIQMGQDTQGNFNFILRGEDGTTTLIDHNGIKEKAIADDLIKGNMISENAVGGKQIDYNSFTEEFNADTNTHALKSSKVLLDKDNQTLDVAFNSLSTKVDSAPPSITTESSINKLDGAIDGMLKLNSIKGKTLQNLFKLNTIIEGSDSIGYWYYRNIHPISDLSNKTVTVFNPTSREIQSSIRTLDNTFIEEIVIPAYSKKVVTLVSNRKIYTATGLKSKGWTEANKTELKAMVLEGDYTNKPIPDYFDGIRSVGESGENLEFISCGKNVFNGDMVFGSVKIEDGTVASNYVRMLTDFIRVKPNTSYKLSGYGSYTISWVTFYDVNKIYLGQVLNYGYKQGNSTLLIPNNAHYCRQCFQHSTTLVQSDLDYINNNFQIEEETVSTNHETYQEHRQLIPLTEQLRGFNGIMDIAKGGLVTKNIDKAVLDENRGWATYSLTTNETYVTFYTSLPSGLKNAPILCDTLPVDHSMYLGTKSMIASGTATGLGIFISLLKYSLTTPDINGFKAWLQANPVTVYFQLATPVETPIKVEQYMKQFKDGYFLTEGSLINPTIELEYSTSIASATSMMKEVTESNTTALNIQQGKIDSLISNTTIIKDGQSIQLKDAYNSTVATVNSINSVISTHTSKIDALTGQITDVETKTNEVIRDLDGVKTSVSSATITANSALSKATEAKQTADGFSQRVGNIETNYATTSAMNSAIAQSATGIKSEVSNTFVSKTDATLTYATKASMTLTENQLRLDFNSIDVTNLLRNSSFSNREISGWALSGVNLYDSNPSYFMPYDGWRAFSLATDRGLLYQSSMVKDRLPKRNTKYTFSLSSITESNIETFRLYIDYKLGSTYVGNQIVNLKAGYNVNRYSVTFTTKDIEYDTFLFYIEIKPKAGTTGYRVFSIGLPCLSKGENGSYTARQNEVISGSTQIDANGVTIFNGALTVKNKASQDVLTANAAGNLSMVGVITTFNDNMTKRQIELIKNGITFYDWETAENNISIGRIYTGKQILKGSTTTTPVLTINNTPASYLAISSDKGMLMHFDAYNKSTYSGNIPIWLYKNAIMDIGAGMYFNMPGDKGQIYGGTNDVLVISVPKAQGNGFKVQTDSGTRLMEARAGYDYVCYMYDTYIDGKFAVAGSKNSIQKTLNYGERLINAYETAEYYYGDIGSGKIINGECVISIDEILLECINTSHQYHVFTQVYNGAIKKIERFKDYFVVYGEEGTEFSWELKAKRIGYENHRLETPNDFDKTESYENMFNRHFEEFEAEKTTERQSVEGDMYTNDTLAGDMLVTELNFKLDDFLLNKEEVA